jgi:hypothetical protein
METQRPEGWPSILAERCKFLGATLLLFLFDGLLFLAWAIAVALIERATGWLDLTGVEKTAADVLRVILELPVFITIFIYVVADIRSVTIRVWRGAGTVPTGRAIGGRNEFTLEDRQGNQPAPDRISTERPA